MNGKVAIALFIGLAAIVQSRADYGAETLIAGTGGSPPVTQSSFVGLAPGGSPYAASFLVPAGSSYALTHLQLAAYHYPGVNGTTATFSINPDANGVPGLPLTSFNASIIESFTEATAALTLTPTGSPVLQGGQKYWLVGRSTSDYVNWVHAFNKFGETAGATGTSWQVSQGSNLPAFAVLGAAVPEPSALILVAIAVAGGVLSRHGGESRRERRS